MPNPGIEVYHVANVFGEWDSCVWFEANNSKHAIEYIENTLSKIPGKVQTYQCLQLRYVNTGRVGSRTRKLALYKPPLFYDERLQALLDVFLSKN